MTLQREPRCTIRWSIKLFPLLVSRPRLCMSLSGTQQSRPYSTKPMDLIWPHQSLPRTCFHPDIFNPIISLIHQKRLARCRYACASRLEGKENSGISSCRASSMRSLLCLMPGKLPDCSSISLALFMAPEVRCSRAAARLVAMGCNM